MKRLLLLMFVAAALSACNENWTEDSVKPRDGITLQLSVPESSIVHTRAQSAAEAALNNLWVFVFDSSGTFMQKCKATDIKNDVHTAKVTLPDGTQLSFYACANVSAAQEALFDGLAKGVAQVADLKAITSNRSLLSAPGLPMWGELLNQTITTATTKINMTLTRNCSRVDVVASGIADFTLSGIEKLLKTANEAPIFPASSLVAASSTIDVVPANTNLSSIYLYENAIVAGNEAAAESTATAVIVKGTYKGFAGYYKLRVKYGSSPVKYDIGRNVIYSINITSVKAPGFATLAEAEANYPQNVDYTVTASDGDATDMVTSNGQYYLGVSNSDYVVYNSDEISNAVVATVTHNAPSSITAGTVTATGTGLTLKTTTIPTTTQKQEILVDMAADFTSGTLTLRLGNLMKVLTIKKKPAIRMSLGLYDDFSATSYVQGDLDESTMWFKLGRSRLEIENTKRRVLSPNGGIWLWFNENVSGAPRTSGAYITSADAKGRTRVVVKQDGAFYKYLGGAPTTNISWTNPASFTLNVSTDLPGWTIEARDMYNNPFAVTFGDKIGTPVRGTPTDCSVLVTVPSNSGPERTIYFYFSTVQDSKILFWVNNVVQEQSPLWITASPPSQSSIPYTGGTYITAVKSTHAWNATNIPSGITVSPTSSLPGTTDVTIVIPANTTASAKSFNIAFNSAFDIYKGTANWAITQEANPSAPPAGSYIPRSVLAAAGWPADRLPPIGLQLAVRGNKVLPGGTPADDDQLMQWKTTNTSTVGVDLITTVALAKLGVGKSSTDAMIKAGAAAHPAAQYCQSMGAEWYVPSLAEIAMIYNNKATLASAYTFLLTYYWTASQNTNYGCVWSFGDGLLTSNYKDSNFRVRCVREI